MTDSCRSQPKSLWHGTRHASHDDNGTAKIRFTCLVVAGLLISGCIDSLPRDAITIINELDHDVIVVARFTDAQGEGERVVEPVLPSGSDAQYRTECFYGDLVARSSETNEEVDWRDGPLCQGDEPWIVDGEPG